MNRQEFIDRLRAALNGRVSPSLVMENVNYYEDYINTEIRKGRSEQEVLSALGDPRLIAKTIIETNGKTSNYQDGNYQESSNYQDAGNYQESSFYKKGYQNSHDNNRRGYGYRNTAGKQFRMPGWLIIVIILLIVVLILGTIFSVLSFLAPVIIPIIVVMFLVKLFRDWLN